MHIQHEVSNYNLARGLSNYILQLSSINVVLAEVSVLIVLLMNGRRTVLRHS